MTAPLPRPAPSIPGGGTEDASPRTNAPIVVIGGATAAGKSALAEALAARVGGELVNADSVQVFRGLDIGSAKPTAAQRAVVAYHLLDICDPTERYSAARFVADADVAIHEIAARGRVPIVVGGTGLYVRSLLRGLFDVDVPPEVRARVEDEITRVGVAAAHARLARIDPAAAARIAPADAIRVARALEVAEATGVPLTVLHEAHALQEQRYNALCYTVQLAGDVRSARIDARVGAMLDAGWVDEVRGLLRCGVPPDAHALGAVGYAEIVAVLTRRASEDGLATRIAQATRGLAKRQRTWFRGQWTSESVDGDDTEGFVESAVRALSAALATRGEAR